MFSLDCEPSLFFRQLATRVRERRAAKPRDARIEGGSSRREKRDCPHSQSQWNMHWPHNAKIQLADGEALTAKCQQSKPLTSWWWLKHCRNVCHVSRKHWHSESRAKWSTGSSYLRSWRYCNFADWFRKKPDFSIVLWDKTRYEPKYVHFSGCPAEQHRGRSDQKWDWHDYTTPTVRDIWTFAVFFSVSRPFMSLHSCLWRALRVVFLDRAAAFFKRS